MDLLVTLHMDEDGVWIAECPDLPGCVSQGATRDEAVENVREAITLCLEVRAERGDPVNAGMVNVQVTTRRPIIDIEYLSVGARILLAQDLWDSISPESPELALTPCSVATHRVGASPDLRRTAVSLHQPRPRRTEPKAR